MKLHLSDISTENDVILLVNTFYKHALSDTIIGVFFKNHISSSLEEHLPTMYDFWNSVLLSKGSYKGNPILTHVNLNKVKKLEKIHFERWLQLWNSTIDKLFAGQIAEQAKEKASLMKDLMLYKIQSSQSGNFIQ